MKNDIVLFGSASCHKTKYYMQFLKDLDLPFTFKDVIVNEDYAKELIALYETRKLNFPTLLLGKKKLRNPSNFALMKWLKKLDYITNTPGITS